MKLYFTNISKIGQDTNYISMLSSPMWLVATVLHTAGSRGLLKTCEWVYYMESVNRIGREDQKWNSG